MQLDDKHALMLNIWNLIKIGISFPKKFPVQSSHIACRLADKGYPKASLIIARSFLWDPDAFTKMFGNNGDDWRLLETWMESAYKVIMPEAAKISSFGDAFPRQVAEIGRALVQKGTSESLECADILAQGIGPLTQSENRDLDTWIQQWHKAAPQSTTESGIENQCYSLGVRKLLEGNIAGWIYVALRLINEPPLSSGIKTGGSLNSVGWRLIKSPKIYPADVQVIKWSISADDSAQAQTILLPEALVTEINTFTKNNASDQAGAYTVKDMMSIVDDETTVEIAKQIALGSHRNKNHVDLALSLKALADKSKRPSAVEAFRKVTFDVTPSLLAQQQIPQEDIDALTTIGITSSQMNLSSQASQIACGLAEKGHPKASLTIARSFFWDPDDFDNIIGKEPSRWKNTADNVIMSKPNKPFSLEEDLVSKLVEIGLALVQKETSESLKCADILAQELALFSLSGTVKIAVELKKKGYILSVDSGLGNIIAEASRVGDLHKELQDLLGSL